MVKKSKTGCLATVLILLIVIVSGITYLLLIWLPNEVQDDFNKRASSSLSLIQRISYPIELYREKRSDYGIRIFSQQW